MRLSRPMAFATMRRSTRRSPFRVAIAGLVLAHGGQLAAQAVTASIAAKSELVATAQSGPSSMVTQRIPPGTILTGAPSTWLIARSFSPLGEAAIADFSPALVTTPTSIDYLLGEACSIIGTTRPKTATMGTHETVLRLHVRARATAMITIEWSASVVPAGGAQLPVAQVDIFDDGTIDFTGVTPGSRLQVPVTLPVGDVPIRTLTRSHIEDPATSPTIVGNNLRIRVEPIDNCRVTEIAPGCSSIWQRVDLGWFGVDVVLPAEVSSGGRAAALVLGLRRSLLSLPFARCALIPSPQLVLPLPSVSGSEVRVPIELSNPALRPIVFYVQTAVLDPSQGMLDFTRTHEVRCPR